MSGSSLVEAVAVVRTRLADLESEGGRVFASVACSFVQTLLRRAETIGGAAGSRLVARATSRVEALGRELDEAKRRARATFGAEEPPDPMLAMAVDAGDVTGALRAARKRQLAPVRSTERHAAWVARMAAEGHARGLSLTGQRRTPGALSAALYGTSCDEVSAMRVALRAEAEISLNAGPYNSLAIAARALAELSTLAPAYLAALIGHLDELAPLTALPAPPPDGARTTSATPRRRSTNRPPTR